MASGSAGASTASAAGRSGGNSLILYAALSALLIVALIGIDLLVLRFNNPAGRLSPHYYLSLGDSLAYGFQPDLNFTAGFSDDLFTDLHKANVTDVVNYSCGGESSTTMIHGNCIGRVLKHDPYFGDQLDAAASFLQAHASTVNPITLDIGSNDVLPDWDATACSALPTADADLATLDTNLTQTILPRLASIRAVNGGPRPSDLFLLNYYNPFAKECPNSAPFVNLLNAHLAADAAQFRIPVVDVYGAFGGDAHQADHICDYTWICSAQLKDVHPTTQGYRVIANVVEQTLGYPGIGPSGANPVPNVGPPIQAPAPGAVPTVSDQP